MATVKAAPEVMDGDQVTNMYVRLSEPFPEHDIEWKPSKLTKDRKLPVLAYIDGRAVMDRLDDVVGFGNWQTKMTKVDGGAVCDLGLKIAGEWVWQSDGSNESNFEGFKGAMSGALKRVVVRFGVGRYLYSLGQTFARPTNRFAPHFTKDFGGWFPPPLPTWALPGGPMYGSEEARIDDKILSYLVLIPAPAQEDRFNELLGEWRKLETGDIAGKKAFGKEHFGGNR